MSNITKIVVNIFSFCLPVCVFILITRIQVHNVRRGFHSSTRIFRYTKLSIICTPLSWLPEWNGVSMFPSSYTNARNPVYLNRRCCFCSIVPKRGTHLEYFFLPCFFCKMVHPVDMFITSAILRIFTLLTIFRTCLTLWVIFALTDRS